MEKGFYYYLGKFTALVGAGMLGYLWLDKNFVRRNRTETLVIEEKNVLVITDENQDSYIVEHPTKKDTNIVEIPSDIDILVFNTSNVVSVHNIMPNEGDFQKGKDLKIGGNFTPYPESSSTDNEEYGFSKTIYNDMNYNDGGISMNINDRNFIEMTFWRKIWWFSV